MKRVLILGMAMLAMISCKKYDDSELWDAVNKLQADTVSNVVTIEKGAIKAAFSVAEGKQVYFSQGNLQYQASSGLWRFAINQWDAIGEDNVNIAEDYSGWIDLFGWGTSGWAESGAVCYQPWSKSSDFSDYYVGGSYEKGLTGAYANADWGVYNKISNGGNQTGLWRVLTKDEWEYVVNERPNASEKFGVATVNGVNGLILLPDEWVMPEGLSFNSGTLQGGEYQSKNCFSLSQWMKMEEYGAIFLPATGIRSYISTIVRYNLYGAYWSSTSIDEKFAANLAFNVGDIEPKNGNSYGEGYNGGRAVRLVQDVK